MHKIKIQLLLMVLMLSFNVNAQVTKPNDLQMQAIKRGYGMFISFGINTFNQKEWSDGTLPVSSYNPTQLDCDKWVADAKEAGMRYVLLITKHHDGFCMWDSKYTDYDVASSPVKTDVIKAVAVACKKYGIKLGLYYSLWDRHEPTFKDPDPQKYITYMKNQLTEILTNYGPICELWFDGPWHRKVEDYDIPGLYALVHKLQPSCAMTVNHTIGVGQDDKQVGKPSNFKEGDIIRIYPVDFRTKDPNLVRFDDPKMYNYKGELHYLPFEHTICISDRWNWFQKKDILPARPLDELEQMFYWTTANDNVLLLNYPPDQTGLPRENERQRLFELADRLGIRGGNKPLPAGPVNMAMKQTATASNTYKNFSADKAVDTNMDSYWMAADTVSSLEIAFNKRVKFDQVSLFEYADLKDLGDGFSIERKFRIKQYNLESFNGKVWKVIKTGTEIGPCATIKFPRLLKTQKLRINILQANKPAGLYQVIVSNSNTRHNR
jgi:alpha-L-fucosidase